MSTCLSASTAYPYPVEWRHGVDMKKTFTLADILKIQLILYKKTTRLTFENSNGGMSSPELDVYFGKILRVSSTLF